MILLILAIALYTFACKIAVVKNNPIPLLLLLVPCILLGVGGFSPILGYEEPVFQKEYELQVMYEPDVYIVQDSDGSVTCRHNMISFDEDNEYYSNYTYYENVEIVPVEDGSKPILRKYFVKAKKSILTFALSNDKMKYVFYVPEKNIEKWQNEHVN